MRYGKHARRATYAVLTSVSIAAIASSAFAHEAGVTGRDRGGALRCVLYR
jgi:hypothetical protein